MKARRPPYGANSNVIISPRLAAKYPDANNHCWLLFARIQTWRSDFQQWFDCDPRGLKNNTLDVPSGQFKEVETSFVQTIGGSPE